MVKRKKSLFDSITMFGKSLPEIFHDARMNDEEIEMFRSCFNDDTDDHTFRMEAFDVIKGVEQYIPTEGQELDRISRLKESMKKGFTPPEDEDQ